VLSVAETFSSASFVRVLEKKKTNRNTVSDIYNVVIGRF